MCVPRGACVVGGVGDVVLGIVHTAAGPAARDTVMVAPGPRAWPWFCTHGRRLLALLNGLPPLRLPLRLAPPGCVAVLPQLIKALEVARGAGTSMISLIMPPKDQVSGTGTAMRLPARERWLQAPPGVRGMTCGGWRYAAGKAVGCG